MKKFILPLYNANLEESSCVYVKCHEIISTEDTYTEETNNSITELVYERHSFNARYVETVILDGHLSEHICNAIQGENFVAVN